MAVCAACIVAIGWDSDIHVF